MMYAKQKIEMKIIVKYNHIRFAIQHSSFQERRAHSITYSQTLILQNEFNHGNTHCLLPYHSVH
jgi:hypothetical protein